ncbi:hypothetical protein QOT17_012653 [Balamuthia mandrillaris]
MASPSGLGGGFSKFRVSLSGSETKSRLQRQRNELLQHLLQVKESKKLWKAKLRALGVEVGGGASSEEDTAARASFSGSKRKRAHARDETHRRRQQRRTHVRHVWNEDSHLQLSCAYWQYALTFVFHAYRSLVYAELYLKHVWLLLPLHPASLYHDNLNHVLTTREGEGEVSSLSLTIYAIIALGSRMCGHLSASQEFYNRARSIAADLFDSTDYSVAEGLTALAYYAMGSNDMQRCTYYLLLARQMCKNLGLFTSPIYLRSTYALARHEKNVEKREKLLMSLMQLPLDESGFQPFQFGRHFNPSPAQEHSNAKDYQRMTIITRVSRICLTVMVGISIIAEPNGRRPASQQDLPQVEELLVQQSAQHQRPSPWPQPVLSPSLRHDLFMFANILDQVERELLAGPFLPSQPEEEPSALIAEELEVLRRWSKASRMTPSPSHGNLTSPSSTVDNDGKPLVLPRRSHFGNILVLSSLRAQCYNLLGLPHLAVWWVCQAVEEAFKPENGVRFMPFLQPGFLVHVSMLLGILCSAIGERSQLRLAAEEQARVQQSIQALVGVLRELRSRYPMAQVVLAQHGLQPDHPLRCSK